MIRHRVPPLLRRRAALLLSLLCLPAVLASCRSAPPPPPAPEPQYARPLGPGEHALRLITNPAREPDWSTLSRQLLTPDAVDALRRSVSWFAAPSSQTHFPVSGVSHQRAQASVTRLLEIAETAWNPGQAYEMVRRDFAAYESVGWDRQGAVLFTGYFSPEFRASFSRTGAYQHPIYRRPADLASDPVTGEVFGRTRPGGGHTPYPTRAELLSSGELRGLELAYLDDPLDAYTVEVNGSAALKMTDGSTLYVGHAGTNGRPYVSVSRALAADGKIDPNRLSLPAVRHYFRTHPEELPRYLALNPRFVFFTEYPASNWPAGSMGFVVEPERSLATDKSIFPRGMAVAVEVVGASIGGQTTQLMFDQDTGGAIRAPGRADVYFGLGAPAEREAGSFLHEGRMIYLLLRE